MSKRVGANNRKKTAARRGKRVKVARKFLVRSLLILLVGAIAVAIAVGGIAGYSSLAGKLEKSDLFGVKKIRVVGNLHMPSEKLVARCGIEKGTKLYRIKAAAVKAAIGADPWIKTVDLKRELNGTVVIKIAERVPVALVNIGGVFQIDREGVLLPLIRDTSSQLPLISGLRDTLDVEGRRVISPDQMDCLNDFVDRARKADGTLINRISQIELSGGRRIRFVMQSSPLVIEIGSDEIERKLQYLKQLEGVLQCQSPVPLRIDLRYQNLAYVMQRENVSEEAVQAVSD